jgi:hypothetical protein
MRLTITNAGSVDADGVNIRATVSGVIGFFTQLTAVTPDPTCGVIAHLIPEFALEWPIGLLQAGQSRSCDLTFAATGIPLPPIPAVFGRIGISPTSSLVSPPTGGQFGATERVFLVAQQVNTLADYAVRFEPSPIRVDPGTSREVSLLITNRGPQSITAAQTRFYGWFERYNLFGPNPEQLDPFRLVPLGPPGCLLQQTGPIISPPSIVELTAVIDPPIAPGETRECRIRVEARQNATGERSLRFTQRILFPGVVDPNLADNIATLQMIFSEPPAVPVPAASRTMLVVMALLLALVGVASFARSYNRRCVRS